MLPQPENTWTNIREALCQGLAIAQKLPHFIILGFFFWFYSLSSYSISIDQEFAALQVNPTEWLRQGRWFVHFLTSYLLPQPVLPYFTTLVFCLCIALSYVLILLSHRLAVDWRALLVFPVFAAFPVW